MVGRRVWREDLGWLGPGPHVTGVGRASELPPGVYRVRVRAARHAAERVFVRTP